MRGRRGAFVTAALLAALAGCSVVAGVKDLDYAAPSPSTETSPTDPAADRATDGGTTSDAANLDAAPAPPHDASADSAPSACAALDFLLNDQRGPNKARLITFPGGGPQAEYAPRCMTVRVGQSVTWQGDFTVDPLAARSQNPPSPITLTATGNTTTFAFMQPGRYRYGSTGNVGLHGAIDVRP